MITEKEEIKDKLVLDEIPRMRVLINEPREAYIECPNNGDPDEILDEFIERLERMSVNSVRDGNVK